VTIVRHRVSRVIDAEDGDWCAEVILSAVRTLLKVATDQAAPVWTTLRVRVVEDELNDDVHTLVVQASVDVQVP